MTKASDKAAAGAQKKDDVAVAAAPPKDDEAAAVENLQTMVGELVKELDLQDGYELGETVSELQNQLGDLNAQKTVRDAKAAVDAAKPKRGECVVSDGVHMTSLRGLLAPGDRVTADDFSGGKDALDDAVKRKIVTKIK